MNFVDSMLLSLYTPFNDYILVHGKENNANTHSQGEKKTLKSAKRSVAKPDCLRMTLKKRKLKLIKMWTAFFLSLCRSFSNKGHFVSHIVRMAASNSVKFSFQRLLLSL